MEKPRLHADVLVRRSVLLVISMGRHYIFPPVVRVFLGVVISYLTWAGSLRLWALDMNRFYHALLVKLHGTWEEPPPSSYDAIGFGQYVVCLTGIARRFSFVSASSSDYRHRAAISSTQTLWANRWQLVITVRHFPSYCRDGVVFLFAGRRNPWRTIQQRKVQSPAMRRNNKRRASELGPQKYESCQSIDSMDDEVSGYLLPTHSFGSWDSQSPHRSGLYGRPSHARNQSASSDSSYRPLLGHSSVASESTTSFVASPQALPPTPHPTLARESFHVPHGHSRTHSDTARHMASSSHRPRAQSSVDSSAMSSLPVAAIYNDTSRPFMGNGGWVPSSPPSHRLSKEGLTNYP
ncbi:hypothetical protein CPB85DRAFT_251620 [Mucidula mucida]|nr:hypothetical protein CPB85DRAFT_251620 [Mucidula mucida]